MKTEIKKLPKCQLEIVCEMPWDEFDIYRVKAIADFSQGVKVPGFRPGKAPKGIIESGIGKEEILLEASRIALQEKFEEIVKTEGVEPAGRPKADILKLAQGNPFCFKIKVNVLPEIALSDYKKIAQGIEKEKIQAAEKEVLDTLDWILRTRAEFKDLNTPAKEGDFVEIEYQSPDVENNKLFKDGFLLGKGGLIKGFEENLKSMEQGQEKEFETVFPEDFIKKELAGKKASFRVKMEKVKEMILPTLNDDFVKTLGKFETVNDLKKNIQEGIRKEKEAEALFKWREKVISEVAKLSKFEAPESLVAIELERMTEELPEEEQEEAKPKLASGAERKFREFLCLKQIGKENEIEVASTEIEQAINRYLTNYPQEKLKEIDMDRLREYYKGMLFNEKVFQKLESFSKK